MIVNNIEDCCNFAVSALDGVYGWLSEATAIVIFVFIFNFLIKWLLWRMHLRFEKQKKFWKDGFVTALHQPLSYFVWFFALTQMINLIAARVYKELPMEDRHVFIEVGAILAVAWFLIRWKSHIVHHMVVKSKKKEIAIDQGKIDGIDKVITVAIIFFVILILLEVTNRSINTLIAFGGVGGLALAFASQEIIANFFGGFMIYLTQPFTIGDWILLPDHSIEGIVEEIGWYMTRIRSLDKRPIYIPNAIFSKLIVITPSRMSHRQIKETIGIRCDDLPKLKPIIGDIKSMLEKHQDLDHQQPVIARLTGFGEYSLDVMINVFTQTTDTDGYMRIKEDVLFKIVDILKKHDAQLSTPSQNITLLGNPKELVN